uniref:Epidermal growth factor receptor pathway substrate 15 n=1 Tax=Petromyzon marinus TaxID=7757 RepID=S4RI05_PETMA
MVCGVCVCLFQLSSGNPVYEKYYRLVDPGNTGQVGAAQAVVFLKKSGLPDLTLGKIWEVADPEGKGYLEKQGFYVALRLVACAQNALNVSLSSLDFPVPVPKFELDSPAMIAPPQGPDIPWAVKPEEKAKFDSIYDSLKPQNGLLSGEKVKPVLLNSKLPVETLGRVWDLSDIDRDGFLDRDEFSVAMYLVYRALEKEPVPLALPIKLIPPAKRKPGLVSSAFALPKVQVSACSLAFAFTALFEANKLLAKHSQRFRPLWQSQAVSAAERLKYDEMFTKLDKDGDGQVTGLEVKEVFMKTGLSPAVLAQIWALSDTRQCGKLTRDQFGMAMHLVQEKIGR